MFQPSYLSLYRSGELEKRAAALKQRLAECDICPRRCRVNRSDQSLGYCGSGAEAEVSSYCDHHGEEPALSGTKGSGTIFFSHCNLKCVYCQNHQISQEVNPASRRVDIDGLAGIMLHLQDKLHCHNINLVSPSHYVPQIVAAIHHAAPMGLKLPVVYNTNAYDSMDTLKLLEGIVDIYLPDIKYASDKWANRFSHGKDYVKTGRAAIKEMYRQVGNLVCDSSGVAQRGLIIRHLILPNGIAGSKDSLKWLAARISRDVTLSVMAQYYPCHLAPGEPLLSRRITAEEYAEVVTEIEYLDMGSGWIQQLDSAESYLPDFKREGHPFIRQE
jgi:putative pyruvate formate lyase activating enzyme